MRPPQHPISTPTSHHKKIIILQILTYTLIIITSLGCNNGQSTFTPQLNATGATKPIAAYWLTQYKLGTGLYQKDHVDYSCKSKTIIIREGNTINYQVSGTRRGKAQILKLYLTITEHRIIQEIDYLIEILDTIHTQLRNKHVQYIITHTTHTIQTEVANTTTYLTAFNAAIKNYNTGNPFSLEIKIYLP